MANFFGQVALFHPPRGHFLRPPNPGHVAGVRGTNAARTELGQDALLFVSEGPTPGISANYPDLLGEQAELGCPDGRLGAIGDPELGDDALHVGLDR